MKQVAVVGGIDVAADRVEVAINWPVTGHSEQESDEARRKREQRERDAAAGVVTLEVRMAASEASMLAAGREKRGSKGVPYTTTEYINTLIRRDHELLQQQLGAVIGRICENCRKPLPRGCGGVWRDEMPCALAQLERAMEL
ncbi:TPA: hypothetical protein ACKP0L_003808 [Pseudomonas putida]